MRFRALPSSDVFQPQMNEFKQNGKVFLRKSNSRSIYKRNITLAPKVSNSKSSSGLIYSRNRHSVVQRSLRVLLSSSRYGQPSTSYSYQQPIPINIPLPSTPYSHQQPTPFSYQHIYPLQHVSPLDRPPPP